MLVCFAQLRPARNRSEGLQPPTWPIASLRIGSDPIGGDSRCKIMKRKAALPCKVLAAASQSSLQVGGFNWPRLAGWLASRWGKTNKPASKCEWPNEQINHLLGPEPGATRRRSRRRGPEGCSGDICQIPHLARPGFELIFPTRPRRRRRRRRPVRALFATRGGNNLSVSLEPLAQWDRLRPIKRPAILFLFLSLSLSLSFSDP